MIRKGLQTLLIVAPLTLLMGAGCKQGEGDRCQVQSDCDDSLLCIIPVGGSVQSGGTCLPRSTDAGSGDMSAATDMTQNPADAGTDL